MFCCRSLQTLAGEAGQKGFAVIAVREGDDRSFCLEARAFDADVVRRYSQHDSAGRYLWPSLLNDDGVEVAYTTSMLLHLRHCPACGAKLADLIARDPDGFDRLAAQQRAANPEFALYDRSF